MKLMPPVYVKPYVKRGKTDAADASMEEVSTIGLDLAKSVFQVHGIDAAGRVVVRP